MMEYRDWIRLAVIIITMAIAIFVVLQIWKWHKDQDNTFDLRELFTTLGKDKKSHLSRPALGELVALFSTTSGYLGVLAVRPQDYETATLVYGGLWVVRGGYSTYIKSKGK